MGVGVGGHRGTKKSGYIVQEKMYVSTLFSICKDAVINLWLREKAISLKLFSYLSIKAYYIRYKN